MIASLLSTPPVLVCFGFLTLFAVIICTSAQTFPRKYLASDSKKDGRKGSLDLSGRPSRRRWSTPSGTRTGLSEANGSTVRSAFTRTAPAKHPRLSRINKWGEVPVDERRPELIQAVVDEYFGQARLDRFSPYIENAMRGCTLRGATGSRPFIEEVRFFTTQLMLDLVYGIRIRESDDRIFHYVRDASKAWSDIVNKARPKSRRTKSLSALFTSSSNVDEGCLSRLSLGACVPFDRTKADIVEDVAKSSFVSRLLQAPRAGSSHYLVRSLAAELCAETINAVMSAVETICRNLASHPATEEKTRAAIHHFTRANRLPSLDDRAHLPIIDNLISEALDRRQYLHGEVLADGLTRSILFSALVAIIASCRLSVQNGVIASPKGDERDDEIKGYAFLCVSILSLLQTHS
ncbi:hypothetical protein DL93DRAFT_2078405 [Clavulina sp. PMI_390]|nr:hypothetical protein DL93DRAFT_2078405 [Clavulina sp. PMI_390]